jgi:hypothetical protein
VYLFLKAGNFGGKSLPPAHTGHGNYRFVQMDHMPKIVRLILPFHPEDAELVLILFPRDGGSNRRGLVVETNRPDDDRQLSFEAERYVQVHDAILWIYYRRTDGRAFDETYKAICNSPRIE